jgi:hypothetical protein
MLSTVVIYLLILSSVSTANQNADVFGGAAAMSQPGGST